MFYIMPSQEDVGFLQIQHLVFLYGPLFIAKVLDDDFVRSPLSCLECILETSGGRVNRSQYEIHPLI